VTPQARESLELRPGVEVIAVWKASASRVTPR
jgi:molybdopterin-binding protein